MYFSNNARHINTSTKSISTPFLKKRLNSVNRTRWGIDTPIGNQKNLNDIDVFESKKGKSGNFNRFQPGFLIVFFWTYPDFRI